MTHEELLTQALAHDDYELTANLLSLKTDVNFKVDDKYTLLTYYYFVSQDNNRELAPRIIEALMQAGADYREAFFLGIRTDDKNFLTLLIENGADVNMRYGGFSPLSVAMMESNDATINISMIEFLAKNGADVNELFSTEDETIATPLNVSIAIDRPDIARILIKYGADVNRLDSRARTPLFYAAVTSNKILRTLLSNGADPNKQGQEGRTPLMLALMDGESEGAIIKSLLEFGADPNIQDNSGMTALMWVIITRDRAPYFLINALIRTGGFRAKGWKTWCMIPEIYLAVKRKIQLMNIKILLDNGADVRIKNHEGMTALTYAATYFDDEISEMLINAGTKATQNK